jgi:heme/copper-type cytochrome/quinol oxidase subunit 2
MNGKVLIITISIIFISCFANPQTKDQPGEKDAMIKIARSAVAWTGSMLNYTKSGFEKPEIEPTKLEKLRKKDTIMKAIIFFLLVIILSYVVFQLKKKYGDDTQIMTKKDKLIIIVGEITYWLIPVLFVLFILQLEKLT